MTDMSQYREAFVADAQTSMMAIDAALTTLQSQADDTQALFEVMRLFHSIKSSSALMGYGDISAQCVAMEQRFKPLVDGKRAASAEDIAAGNQAVAHILVSMKAV